MKTLYININNEQIQSNEELEVLNYDLDSDFFFYLGERISKDCNVENENALITDFNTQDNEEDYQQIISQWSDIKTILFSEECEGKFEFTLPNGYIHWLKFHSQYVSIYDKNFSTGESRVISIDLEELYEESVEELQRKILRRLKRNDLYLEVVEFVFNDDAVTRKSSIVRTIKEKHDGIGFKTYKKWKENQLCFIEEIVHQEDVPNISPENIKASIYNEEYKVQSNNIKTFITFLCQKKYLFIDNNNELVLRFPTDTKFGGGTSYGELGNDLLSIYLWKIFKYEYDIYMSKKQLPIITSIPLMAIELLEDRIIRMIDEKIVLALNFHSIENFADDFENDLKSNHINISRYLRYHFNFEFLNNNLEETLVSWEFFGFNEYYGYITKTKLLCNRIYKKIEVAPDNDEIIVIKDDCKKYILNKSTGKILPIEFMNTPHFYEDLAKVLNNGKWGYIDTSGNMVISTQFEEASNFSNGTAMVKLKGKHYLINRRGELFEGYVPLDKR